MRRYIFCAFLLLELALVLTNSVHADGDYTVKKVEFEGDDHFKAGRLKQLMISSPPGFPLSIFTSSDYIPDLFRDDIKNIEEFYHNMGYLKAAVVDTQLNFLPEKKEVTIKITIHEGELTHIEGISFFGNTVFTDSALAEKVKLKVEGPLRRIQINDGEFAILSKYANNGYLEAEIETEERISDDSLRAIIDFTIREGRQFTIDKIQLKGLEKTNRDVVMRELLFEEGEIVRYSKLLESQRELYLTGLFESVFIRPDSTLDDSLRDVIVELKEKQYGEFNVAVGYGTIDKIRGSVEVFYSNLAGTGRKIGLVTRASFIRRYVEASFTEPRTVGLPWRTDVNSFLEYREDPGFDLNRIGAKVTFGRNIAKKIRLSLAYKYEQANIKNVKVTPIPEDVKTNIRSLILSSVYDTRNNLFDPSRGMFAELKEELAGGFLQGTNAFFRSTAEVKYFHPLSRSTVIATAVRLGWMKLIGNAKDIPLNEKLYAGGPETLRAFDFQSIGPLDGNGIPIGGKLQLVMNAFEVRQTIYKWIGMVTFLDVGNVWAETDQFRIRDMRLSPGIGLRLSTPIGLARMDFGVNIDPRTDEPFGKVYFSLGQAF